MADDIIDFLRRKNPQIAGVVDDELTTMQALPMVAPVPEGLPHIPSTSTGSMISAPQIPTPDALLRAESIPNPKTGVNPFGGGAAFQPDVDQLQRIRGMIPLGLPGSLPFEEPNQVSATPSAPPSPISQDAPQLIPTVPAQIPQTDLPTIKSEFPQIGGSITRDSTGETTFFQQGGGAFQPTAPQISQFQQESETRPFEVTGPSGFNVSAAGAQNIAEGRPPNVSAAQVQAAQRNAEEIERETRLRQVDSQVADFERGLPQAFGGDSRAKNAAASAQLRAALMSQANSGAGVGDLTFDQQLDLRQQQFREGQAVRQQAAESQEASAKRSEDILSAASKIGSLGRSLENVAEAGEEAIGLTMKPRTEGLIGVGLAKLSPTSTASQLNRALQTLKGDAFIEGMREIKAFGGGLGSVTEVEGRKVEAARSKLLEVGMSDEAMRRAINDYIDTRERAFKEVFNAAKLQFGDDFAQSITGVTGEVQSQDGSATASTGSMKTPSGRKVTIQ